MSITNYTPSYCEYKRSKLMDVVYLLTEEDYNKVTLANGAAYNLDDTIPIALSCYNVEFTEEETLDERYRFTKTLKFTMKGYNNIDTLGGGLYAIIFTTEGGAYLVNSEFQPKITYTYNLSNNQNETQFTLSSQSNSPSLFAFWYDMPSPEYRWVTAPIDEDYVCDDCGYEPPLYRWVVNPYGTECSGTTTMTQEIQQVSHDNGETWENTSPLVTRMGSTIIERRGSDCCFIPPTSVDCEYVGYGIDNVKFGDKDFTTLNENTNTITLYNGATFKDVEWLDNSCSFQETFDGKVFTDTIAFDIDMDDYNSTWHYRLFEFNLNRYTAIVTPKYQSNKYLVGFNFGLQPSYTIQGASNNGETNRITITFTERSIYGIHVAPSVTITANTNKTWKYTDKAVIDGNFEVDTYECTNNNQATYLVQEEIDGNSNPTGRYKVLDGYEDRFKNLMNVIGTFNDEVTFFTTKCSWYKKPPQYQWVVVSGGYECSGTTKMTQEKKQVSYDGGTTWSDIIPTETRASLPVIETESEDCGYVPPQYQWVVVSGGYECSGTTKMTQEKKQVSYDGGTTWSDVIPTETRAALPVIETQSEDCGYVPPPVSDYKFRLETLTGLVSVDCDGTNIVTDNETFNYRDSMRLAEIGDCVETIGTHAFSHSIYLTSVTISNYVKTIGDYAFSGCTILPTITIPDSVTSIGENAFRDCSGLTSVSIPNSVTSIGWGAFYNCSGLTNVSVGSGVTSINNDVFANCISVTSITIPNTITSIGDFAFYACRCITSINIPSGVTSIGSGAFNGCIRLTSVTIPSGVTSISNNTFWGCMNLTSVTIPSGVTSIGNYAFMGCTSLTSIDIPSSVTSIGEWAFTNCSSLTSIYVNATTPPTIGENPFLGSTCPIYVPSASLSAYQTAWSTYSSRIQAKP